MGRMTIVVPDKLEAELREKAAKKLGLKKGSISNAVIEAITDWVKKN